MTVESTAVESLPASDPGDAVERTMALVQLWNPSGRERRKRIGRGAVMAFIRTQVGIGAGVPDAEAIAKKFGWQVSSAHDALTGLVADGLLRIEAREPPHGRALYAITAAGASAAAGRASRRPASIRRATRLTAWLTCAGTAPRPPSGPAATGTRPAGWPGWRRHDSTPRCNRAFPRIARCCSARTNHPS